MEAERVTQGASTNPPPAAAESVRAGERRSNTGVPSRDLPVVPIWCAIGSAIDQMARRLLGLAIERVNQVWCSDITYVPMTKGFLYLVVIMDWVSRAVLAVTNIEHTRRRFLRRGTR